MRTRSELIAELKTLIDSSHTQSREIFDLMERGRPRLFGRRRWIRKSRGLLDDLEAIQRRIRSIERVISLIDLIPGR